MTLREFRLLDRGSQAAHLYDQGTFIGKRRLYGGTAVLYQVESFYVEIRYSHYRHTIAALRSFRSTLPLDPYLSAIDVEELVNP